MKTFASAWSTALAAGEGLVTGALRIQGASSTLRYWGGYGDLTLGGEVYTGIGDRALITASGASLGGAANPITVEITGIDDTATAIRDLVGLRGAFIRVWRLGFDSNGVNLLDNRVWHRGRLDKATLVEAADEPSRILCEIDGPARTLGRALSRMGSDADQRITDANDDCFKYVNVAADKKLAWGGKPPQRAKEALPNSGFILLWVLQNEASLG